jgi:murein DD-endopeptidase MepM/ murein hydrolase activator NlpD
MRRRAIIVKIVFLITIMIGTSWANMRYSLSSEKIANAQTILFEMESDEVISKAYVAYLGVRYPFYKAPVKEGYYALVPTGYYVKPKKTKAVIVRVIDGKKEYTPISIMIEKGAYQSERLHVASSRATISKKNRARIKKETQEAKKIYATFTTTSYISEPFLPPLESKITSVFGTKRLFNGVLKSYHSGTDFRAAVGVPIVAANRGKVVLVKNRFFAGNSVIIDHGQGIYTGYYHLSKFKVKRGDIVERGEVIGLAGATGRVTGPHLHFAVHVGGVGVDPMQFLALYNRLYE